MRDLWRCPECGAGLVTRNMPHACGAYTVEGFLEGRGPRARALFAAFEALIARCGPYERAPAKTRVAFQARTRFASVNTLSERGMSIHFGLTRVLRSARIRRIDDLGAWKLHHMRILEVAELDDELLAWLRESQRTVGMQERLTAGSTRSAPAGEAHARRGPAPPVGRKDARGDR